MDTTEQNIQETTEQTIGIKKRIVTEYIPMALTFIGILTCAILFKQSAVKTLPVCISLLIMLLNSRANRFGFLLGAMNSMIYLIGYLSERLYGTALSTLFGAVIQMSSFFLWKRNSYKKTATKFRLLKNGWRILLIVAILLAWAVASFVLHKTGGNEAFLDAFVLIIGVVLPIADMFAVIDAMPLRILNPIVQLFIWVKIVFGGNIANLTYVISMLYTVYMTIRQSVRWVALYKEQKEEENNEDQRS